MERLYEQYTGIDEAKSYCVTLSNNYRCLPEILQLSSDLFYKSSLVPCAKVPRIKEYALHFRSREAVSVAALADCESIKEADIIVKEVEQLIFDDYIDTTNICIMCSSQRQVSVYSHVYGYVNILSADGLFSAVCVQYRHYLGSHVLCSLGNGNLSLYFIILL